MKKFGGLLNKKKQNHGKFEEDSLRGDGWSSDEELNTNTRKPNALSDDRNAEDIKSKKSFSLRSLSPFKPQESMDTDDDYTKKKTSSLRNMPADKDTEKLNESDDKAIRKSFSLRSMSLFKSQDQMRSNDPILKSPTGFKAIFASQYEQADFDDGNDEESDGEEAQAVPKRTRRPRVNSEPGDFDTSPPATMRVPASPPVFLPNTARAPAASSPPALVPSPYSGQISTVPQRHVLAADEFDAQFRRMRTDSITDDYGAQYARVRADSVADVEPDDNLIASPTGNSNSIFSSLAFNTNNKSRKLK